MNIYSPIFNEYTIPKKEKNISRLKSMSIVILKETLEWIDTKNIEKELHFTKRCNIRLNISILQKMLKFPQNVISK